MFMVCRLLITSMYSRGWIAAGLNATTAVDNGRITLRSQSIRVTVAMVGVSTFLGGNVRSWMHLTKVRLIITSI